MTSFKTVGENLGELCTNTSSRLTPLADRYGRIKVDPSPCWTLCCRIVSGDLNERGKQAVKETYRLFNSHMAQASKLVSAYEQDLKARIQGSVTTYKPNQSFLTSFIAFIIPNIKNLSNPSIFKKVSRVVQRVFDLEVTGKEKSSTLIPLQYNETLIMKIHHVGVIVAFETKLKKDLPIGLFYKIATEQPLSEFELKSLKEWGSSLVKDRPVAQRLNAVLHSFVSLWKGEAGKDTQEVAEVIEQFVRKTIHPDLIAERQIDQIVWRRSLKKGSTINLENRIVTIHTMLPGSTDSYRAFLLTNEIEILLVPSNNSSLLLLQNAINTAKIPAASMIFRDPKNRFAILERLTPLEQISWTTPVDAHEIDERDLEMAKAIFVFCLNLEHDEALPESLSTRLIGWNKDFQIKTMKPQKTVRFDLMELQRFILKVSQSNLTVFRHIRKRFFDNRLLTTFFAEVQRQAIIHAIHSSQDRSDLVVNDIAKSIDNGLSNKKILVYAVQFFDALQEVTTNCLYVAYQYMNDKEEAKVLIERLVNEMHDYTAALGFVWENLEEIVLDQLKLILKQSLPQDVPASPPAEPSRHTSSASFEDEEPIFTPITSENLKMRSDTQGDCKGLG